jgi:hypothetical protein
MKNLRQINAENLKKKVVPKLKAFSPKKKAPPKEKREAKVALKKRVSAAKQINIHSTEENYYYRVDEEVVLELARRWWMALPDWPPVDHDYS